MAASLKEGRPKSQKKRRTNKCMPLKREKLRPQKCSDYNDRQQLALSHLRSYEIVRMAIQAETSTPAPLKIKGCGTLPYFFALIPLTRSSSRYLFATRLIAHRASVSDLACR
jgi:hypothetical protein